ncbi:MAG: hypothetical protein ACI31A_08365 [Candidatus Limisoma sp.]
MIFKDTGIIFEGRGKSDGHKYKKYELDGISKSLKKNITKKLESKKEHSDSIFPDKFEYGNSSYKMTIDKKSHYIIFYTIEKQVGKTYRTEGWSLLFR